MVMINRPLRRAKTKPTKQLSIKVCRYCDAQFKAKPYQNARTYCYTNPECEAKRKDEILKMRRDRYQAEIDEYKLKGIWKNWGGRMNWDAIMFSYNSVYDTEFREPATMLRTLYSAIGATSMEKVLGVSQPCILSKLRMMGVEIRGKGGHNNRKFEHQVRCPRRIWPDGGHWNVKCHCKERPVFKKVIHRVQYDDRFKGK